MKSAKRKIYYAILFVSLIFGSFGFIVGGLLAAKQTNKILNGKGSELDCPKGDLCVYLRENSAQPDVLAARVGEYVQFISADNKSHSLSLGKGGEEHRHDGPFTSGEFAADEAWRVQFKEIGTYYFHDHLNPDTAATVVIYRD